MKYKLEKEIRDTKIVKNNQLGTGLPRTQSIWWMMMKKKIPLWPMSFIKNLGAKLSTLFWTLPAKPPDARPP